MIELTQEEIDELALELFPPEDTDSDESAE